MLEVLNNEHFPLLPFDAPIPYLNVATPSNNNINEKMNENYLNNDIDDKNGKPKNKKKKTTIKMNEKAENFKYSFYKMFTQKKKFPKKYVRLIHNSLCYILKLKRINRDETRSIDLYFTHFADHSEKILLCIEKNKLALVQKFPELLNFLE